MRKHKQAKQAKHIEKNRRMARDVQYMDNRFSDDIIARAYGFCTEMVFEDWFEAVDVAYENAISDQNVSEQSLWDIIKLYTDDVFDIWEAFMQTNGFEEWMQDIYRAVENSVPGDFAEWEEYWADRIGEDL